MLTHSHTIIHAHIHHTVNLPCASACPISSTGNVAAHSLTPFPAPMLPSEWFICCLKILLVSFTLALSLFSCTQFTPGSFLFLYLSTYPSGHTLWTPALFWPRCYLWALRDAHCMARPDAFVFVVLGWRLWEKLLRRLPFQASSYCFPPTHTFLPSESSMLPKLVGQQILHFHWPVLSLAEDGGIRSPGWRNWGMSRRERLRDRRSLEQMYFKTLQAQTLHASLYFQNRSLCKTLLKTIRA